MEEWPIWRRAVLEPVIDQAIERIYEDLDAAVAERNPTCWISGRCCDFDAFGHRLYVTGLEIAWVLRRVDALDSVQTSKPGSANAPCVYQKEKLCTIHKVRPLGCRLFFCQEGTQDWQQELYEQFMQGIRRLHEAHDLPYQYMEWRVGLSEAMAAQT